MINGYIKSDIVSIYNKGYNIAHGCNCFCTMGAGVAGQLKSAHREIYNADLRYSHYTPVKDRLGKYSVAYNPKLGNICYNLYTQFRPGRNVDYGAIYNSFSSIDNNETDMLYIPRIGAGIAGGDWGKISELINIATPKTRIIVVDYFKSPENSLFED